MNKPALIAQRHLSQVVVIDVQQKLCAAMPAEAAQTMLRNIGILLQAAALLDVPSLYTEQYPQGLGPTMEALQPWLEKTPRVEKTVFSCWQAPGFRQHLTSDRPQIVLAGMEAHICVLQTALDLQAHGHQVIIAADAVLSRQIAHRDNALQRLLQAGVMVSNTESIVFEWLGAAGSDAFKQISKLIR
ncbi:MAG TPA: isochorismatase family protein [Methylovorus sp.]|jgi:nicotinamidase-related amidase|nr:isochorismatase family protein [Methylovorus sp.]